MEPSDPPRQATDSRAAPQPPAARSVAGLLAALEELSRRRPDRVLRLRGRLWVDAKALPARNAAPAKTEDPFELLIFRGFSSSVTHPTAFDPDRPALPEDATIETAELLVGPLDPSREEQLAPPQAPEAFLSPDAW